MATADKPLDGLENDFEFAEWMQVPATWGAYLRLARARGEKGRPRYTFLDGRLTIVSPGFSHELLKTRLSWMVETALVRLDIDFRASGELTLRRGGRKWRKGTEGDASFYLTNIDKVSGRSRIRMGEDPPPDLVIQVVVSHAADEALKVLAAFGVKEVWLCNALGLKFLVLGPDGRYCESATSQCLPFFVAEELDSWVRRQDLAREVDLRRLFFDWIDDILAPRLRPQPPAPRG
jgi:Uma2 family endonuclease